MVKVGRTDWLNLALSVDCIRHQYITSRMLPEFANDHGKGVGLQPSLDSAVSAWSQSEYTEY